MIYQIRRCVEENKKKKINLLNLEGIRDILAADHPSCTTYFVAAQDPVSWSVPCSGSLRFRLPEYFSSLQLQVLSSVEMDANALKSGSDE